MAFTGRLILLIVWTLIVMATRSVWWRTRMVPCLAVPEPWCRSPSLSGTATRAEAWETTESPNPFSLAQMVVPEQYKKWPSTKVHRSSLKSQTN